MLRLVRRKEKFSTEKCPYFCTAFSPDGKVVAAGGGMVEDVLETLPKVTELKVWELSTGKECLVLKGIEEPVRSLAWSPDGTLLACGCGDLLESSGEVILWDIRTKEKVARIAQDSSEPLSVSFSPDGKTLASGGSDGNIRLWSVAKLMEKKLKPPSRKE